MRGACSSFLLFQCTQSAVVWFPDVASRSPEFSGLPAVCRGGWILSLAGLHSHFPREGQKTADLAQKKTGWQ
jgi:hypothetical protein